MALKPNIVTHSAVEIPRACYGYGAPPARPAEKRVNRAQGSSFTIGFTETTSLRRSLTPAQQKAAVIQSEHKQCGVVKHRHCATPTELRGFKEWDVKRVEVPKAALSALAAPGRDDAAAEEDIPLDRLVDHPWELPRVDVVKQRDPYLRAHGLHKNDVFLMSHMMKRMMAAKDFANRPSVDFNFRGYIE